MYEEKDEIVKGDMRISDWDDKKMKMKGRNKIDDKVKVNYKVRGNDN